MAMNITPSLKLRQPLSVSIHYMWSIISSTSTSSSMQSSPSSASSYWTLLSTDRFVLHFIFSRTSEYLPQLSSLHSSQDTPGAIIHQKDVRLAYVSLVIVAVFISCHSVKWVPNMWELRQAEMDKVHSPTLTLISEVAYFYFSWILIFQPL